MNRSLSLLLAASTSILSTLALTGCGAGADAAGDGEGESASQAAALATCSGASCDGKDPNAAGCNDGSTYTVACRAIVDASGVQIGRVALRYSPTCRAAWGRTVTYVTDNQVNAAVGISSSPFLEKGSATGSFTSVLSPMYDASQSLLATGSIIKLNGNGFGASTAVTYAPTAPQVPCQ